MYSKIRREVTKTKKVKESVKGRLLKTKDVGMDVCKQGDVLCWQRWSSAMTDCV